MSGPDKKLLIAVWIVWAALLLLFANGVSAEPFIKDDGATVTMDKETYIRGVNQMTFQQKLIDRLGNRVQLLEGRYKHIEDCVMNSAASGLATTPCFNVIKDPTRKPEMSVEDMKDVMRFLKNKTEM